MCSQSSSVSFCDSVRSSRYEKPEHPPPTTPTLNVYAAGYLKRAEHTLKYSTWKDYGGNLDKHILPALGPRHLEEITRRDVKALAFALRDGKLKPKTVRKVIGTLSTILGDALDDGLIPANPAAQLKKVYRSDKFKGGAEDDEINPLTAAELAHLITTAETHVISCASITGGSPTTAISRPPGSRLFVNASASAGTEPVRTIAS